MSSLSLIAHLQNNQKVNSEVSRGSQSYVSETKGVYIPDAVVFTHRLIQHLKQRITSAKANIVDCVLSYIKAKAAYFY